MLSSIVFSLTLPDTSFESIFTEPKSLIIAPIFNCLELFRILLNKVVFPAPKNPDIIITGILRFLDVVFWLVFWEKSSKISSIV